MQSTTRSESMPRKATADVVVIGGGIVGLATAMRLIVKSPTIKVAVVEAESHVAAHQSGHNSGVLHSGIYYKPGSVKAITCRKGKAAMEQFCEEEKIPWDRCGKVVVATRQSELTSLDRIAQRATDNGVAFERINTDLLRELEPCAAGIAALHVPETGIVNYAKVCEAMSQRITRHGGSVNLGFDVVNIETNDNSVCLKSRNGATVDCGRMVNCAGLQSDRILRLSGGKPSVKIVPFRGEYYELQRESESLCRNLIYPVPDPSFPFLGVHFTRMIEGGVECGPNAVLALARHGYDWKTLSPKDLFETLSYPGFCRLAWSHWRMGIGEIRRSLNKGAFVRALQKLVPSIRSSDLKPRRAGVRAQAVTPEGGLVDDFLIEETQHAIHVLNAPSPAATASIAIADTIVERVDQAC
ncbi:L-2-hydroxyglutarate oxidase LhgO [Planctomycetes bacterium CA13]|uniref:L-2-hydroxyglutarate oxidase LhgO n=1 Tax=Novipirellula herctigrandis TaxID=2527986 RepID=A0A5C5YPE2_9BACT|nr:L-2-hydroxyglutarate oxidase LhgO [Planctomycetes bacterium CA13]